MNQSEFAKRRKRLMQNMGKDSIAIIPTAVPSIRNRDVEYPYRADSDFYYITGFREPEAVAVLAPKRKDGEYLLFCRERNAEKEIWDGARAGLEGAVEQYGADDAFPYGDLDDILPGLLESRSRVFYTMGVYAEFDKRVIQWLNTLREQSRSGCATPGEFIALDHHLHDMRLIKSRAEINTMREAAKISAQAHIHAMQKCKPGMMEYELEAELLHQFRRKGCEVAYSSIVGGGNNSCVLHYVSNNQELNDGDLVLIDAGAEKDYYASDITRTFPISGRFSKEQKAIYEIVLQAQQDAIAAVKPGNNWNQPNQAAIKRITKGLVKLGLLKGRVTDLIKKKEYRRFYMHGTGHWLGLDVHDVGDYKIDDAWRMLEPGMVLTIEPGIYIPEGSKLAKKWWGIGVRIEDDVLVTKNGHEVLSKDVPKAINDIENLMGAAQP